MVACELAASKGEARRLVQQGGVSVDDQKVTDPNTRFTTDDIKNTIVIRKGKKVYLKVTM